MNQIEKLEKEEDWMNFKLSYLNFLKISKGIYLRSKSYVLGRQALICDEEKNIIFKLSHEAIIWSPKWLLNNQNIKEEVEKRKSELNKIKEECFGEYSLKRKDFIEIENAVFMLHPFSFYAYGHLYDTLLRLHKLENISLPNGTVFLVSNYNRIIDFELHFEILLGYKPIIINIASTGKIAKVENLIVPIAESVPVTFTKNNYIWLREKYINYFGINNAITIKYKLYLSRNHISPGQRSVINEREVVDYLEKSGFIILKGDEPLNKIIEYFYNAEIIIGYHGSLFANTIFCEPFVRILEFCADNRRDYSFATKYKLAKNYTHKLIEADEKFNAYLDLEVVKDFLADEQNNN
jgi:hypothetical protein